MAKHTTSVQLDDSQPIFMGIDVHKHTWSITLVHCGSRVARATLPADITELQRWIRRYEGFHIVSVYEAGFCGFHLHYNLEALGIHNIVTPPNKIPTLTGDKVKTDKLDSLKLATFLAKGLLPPIYIPPKEQLDKRQIIRTREYLKRKRTRAINQIKALLIQNGIALRSVGVNTRLLEQIRTYDLPTHVKLAIDLFIGQLELLDKQMKTLKDAYLATATDGQFGNTYRLLLSTPGIGPLIAAALTYEIGDWHRFHNEKQVAAFFGLTPSEHSSGAHVYRGRITGQGNPMLRAHVVEAAWRLIKADPVMAAFYRRVTKQTGSRKKAIVAVARKLVCRLYSMIKHNVGYEIGVGAPA
jgi:transposase